MPIAGDFIDNAVAIGVDTGIANFCFNVFCQIASLSGLPVIEINTRAAIAISHTPLNAMIPLKAYSLIRGNMDLKILPPAAVSASAGIVPTENAAIAKAACQA